MTKVFSVRFRETRSSSCCGSSGYNVYPTLYDDNKPTFVIANSIKEVAEKFPSAVEIVEYDVKEVVILNEVICPVKHD